MMTRAEDKCEIWAVDEEKVTEAKKRLLADETFTMLSETFGALADSNRAKILHSLAEEELCVCDIACVVGISDSAVSQHLRILRTLRLVKQRKEGRMMYYSLSDNHIRQLLEICLEHTRHWNLPVSEDVPMGIASEQGG
ncbi:MAG: metalloregulator ArsR/SmtB family transcription factor [Dehalococcoidales bacterium]|nr:metalloregulator ArsR/SmtB family transcription factor [Dehalococcoidales bacterium]